MTKVYEIHHAVVTLPSQLDSIVDEIHLRADTRDELIRQLRRLRDQLDLAIVALEES